MEGQPSQWAAGMWPERPCGSWHRPWAPCFRIPSLSSSIWDTTGEVLFGLESRGGPLRRKCPGPWLPPLRSAAWARSWIGISLLCPGGEKQRIACASAWAMGPEVFVLDEPSSNLDGEGIRQLRDILRRAESSGKNRPGGRAPSVVRCRPG